MSVSGTSDALWSLSAWAAAALFNLCSSHLSDMTMYARPITTGIYKETKALNFIGCTVQPHKNKIQVLFSCSLILVLRFTFVSVFPTLPGPNLTRSYL